MKCDYSINAPGNVEVIAHVNLTIDEWTKLSAQLDTATRKGTELNYLKSQADEIVKKCTNSIEKVKN